MQRDYREGLHQADRDTGWRVRCTPGPWITEPDWAAWVDEQSGYPCAAQRNHSGSWCGYVFIPDGHPIDTPRQQPVFDDDIGAPADLTMGDPVWLDCHGGVTWHRHMDIPEAGLSGTAVGFDCSHSGDRSPTEKWAGGTYCDLRYVINETTSLAEQISEYGRLEQLINAGSK